jgi:hypothetical protein
MKIYIAGKINGNSNYKIIFAIAEKKLQQLGNIVMSPAILPDGFDWNDYMHICYAMIDVCGAVYMLNNWKDSQGAMAEHEYAVKNNKTIFYEMPNNN